MVILRLHKFFDINLSSWLLKLSLGQHTEEIYGLLKASKFFLLRLKRYLEAILLSRRHLFHLVTLSPWPFYMSVTVFFFFLCFTLYLNNFIYIENFFLLSFLMIICIMFFWWNDVIRESTFLGYHTSIVQSGLKIGMLLFIVTEGFLFFGFFWAFFHSSFSATVEIGCNWPPTGITVMYYAGVPLLNTLILLSSGATVTWAHYSMTVNNYYETIVSLFLTLALAAWFTFFQLIEYFHAEFGISDSIYGSVFYMLTGFHGFHVFVGTIFLFVCFIRVLLLHFTPTHHVGFELAAWYWHFVDLVWLGLFVSVYWWGGSSGF